jgi:hypothetical protein
MTVRAIFVECSVPFWIDVVENLSKQYEWEPIYWTGDPDFGVQMNRKFPDVVFHSNIDAIRGIAASKCRSLQPTVIDQVLLEQLAFSEAICLNMMNRMDRNNIFSFPEREQLFKQYLRYWDAVLDHFSPDVVVSPVSPHLMYDYVLYSLCKQKKIRTILFEQTNLDEWIYPEERFEIGSMVLKNRHNELLHSWETGVLKKISLSENTESHLRRMSSDYKIAVPFFMKEQFAQNNLIKYFGRKIIRHPQEIPQMLEKGRYLFSRSHYIKKRGMNITESDVKGWDYFFCKIEGMQKKNALKRHYKALEKPADLQQNYIYIPLHYQPENTSCPLGEAFVDQFLIIDMLSKFAPTNWKIYVKEHTSQWHPKLHGECSRSTDFYDRVASLPNVQLIPVSTPNFGLIDHARAVVTITGTAGWEAIVRGKPVLLYGHAWYKFCEGVFYVPSVDACKAALSKIQAGFTIDHERVRLFLLAIEQIGAHAYVEPSLAKIVDINLEENISQLTTSIQAFYIYNNITNK